MHSLSATYVVNVLTWTQESLTLKRTWMDGCLGYLNEMINAWVSSQRMCLSKPRWLTCPKTWDDIMTLLWIKMTMRCNVVVSHTIGHARTNNVCGRTSFSSTQVIFGWQRQTLWRSDEAKNLGEKYAWLEHELDNMDNCGMYYVRNLKNSPMMRLLMNDVLYAFPCIRKICALDDWWMLSPHWACFACTHAWYSMCYLQVFDCVFSLLSMLICIKVGC